MKKMYLLPMLLTFLLTACAGNDVIKPDSKIAPENGAIVASVTKTKFATDAWFFYKKVGENKPQRMEAVGFVMLAPPDDFPENKAKIGRVMAYQVPPGNYELTGWQMYIYNGGGAKYIEPKKIKPLPFTVKAGQSTYLGNLHLETVMGRNIFRMPIPAGAIASINDNKNIDLPILKKKYPNIGNLPVNVSVPKVDMWGLK